MDTKGYELPDLDNIDRPEKAAETINKIYADAFGGEGDHPYLDANHPQHQDFLRAVEKLNAIKMEREDMRTDLEKGLSAALEHQEERQAAQFAEAESIMDELTATGYPRHELRDDITKYEIALLRMRLQVARGEYDRVVPELEQELHKLNAPPAHHQTLRALQDLPDSMGKSKEQLAESLLLFVQTEKRKKFGRLNVD
jgi:hypothetical protein